MIIHCNKLIKLSSLLAEGEKIMLLIQQVGLLETYYHDQDPVPISSIQKKGG